jgi:formylglycine-generating enzyme required for sulfatase activity
MASRQIKMPVKDESDKELDEAPSQRKRPERGRYLLQVDRQTKGSYQTAEAAQAAAMVIKKGYPVVQVSVYDSVDYTDTLVEAPAAAS